MAEADRLTYSVAVPPQRFRMDDVPVAANSPQNLGVAVEFSQQEADESLNLGSDRNTDVVFFDHAEPDGIPNEVNSLAAGSDEQEAIPSPVDRLAQQTPCPHPIWHPIRFVGWVVSTVFGIVTLILGLAVVAAIPLVNFIALGYLLEAEGRVARTGRFRDAFPLLPLAPRIGGIVLGVWFWLIPLRFLAWTAADARLIAQGSPADFGWHLALRIAMVVVTIHLCLALARGGRLSCFFRPFKNLFWLRKQWKAGGYWASAEQSVWEFFSQFRRSYYFWKGLKAAAGAMLWLIIPTALFAAANKPNGGAAFVSIFGGVLLSIVFAWVPFLQAHYSIDGRFSAFRQLGTIREMYRRAPLCWALAASVTYALSLPLFFATIVLPPQDALWLVTPIFIISIYPARVLTGWAYYQASIRERRAWFSLRLVTGLLVMPVMVFYTFILFFTQFIGSSGKWVLFQHHALLLPRPF
jgi:hypothetical protein